jgi:hypothetical protein
MKFVAGMCVGLAFVVTACGSGSDSNSPTNAQTVDSVTAPVGTVAVPVADATPAVPPVLPVSPITEVEELDRSVLEQLKVKFQARVGQADLRCSARTAEDAALEQVFTDVRMFVTNLSLIDASGKEFALDLDIAPNFANLQYKDQVGHNIALLNFLDPDCASSDGTDTVKSAISGRLPQGSYTALKFQIGLPYLPYADELTSVPASLAPSDMGWMWEHLPADIQIEMYAGRTKKMLNSLISKDKTVVVLPLSYEHRAGSVRELTLGMDLGKIFSGNAEAFVRGLENACNNSNKKLAETSVNCAQAYRALGLPLSNPKQPYEQTVFSVR